MDYKSEYLLLLKVSLHMAQELRTICICPLHREQVDTIMELISEEIDKEINTKKLKNPK